MNRDPILAVVPLAMHWPTLDPFLFCAHHDDAFPAGNEHLGPSEPLDGRTIGSDFGGKDGWNMYHGDVVPGFPQHPHRGFETVTIARSGFIDHWDSLGATARFGQGDCQWLTAGKGIVHCEMFPLVNEADRNPAELFQIWLNLPAASKMADPHFSMFWKEAIPTVEVRDAAGKATRVDVVAGAFGDATPQPPPPESWAARDEAHVGIWTAVMEPGASWTLPPAPDGVDRVVYFFRGKTLRVGDRAVDVRSAIQVRADAELRLVNGDEPAELLVLQGRPIGEPVAQHGPFVMNTREELQRAFADYQATRFGGWPWPSDGPVHPRGETRFARHPDGREERGGRQQ